jgi:hypothetical protein
VIDFFQEAPAGAIVLVLAGLALWIVEIPLWIRRRAQLERSREGGPIVEPVSRLPLLVTPLSWVLIVGGLAWYVLAP